MQEGLIFSMSLPTLVILWFYYMYMCVCFNESYSNRYEIVTHCDFDMHFSDDKGLNNFLHASWHWVARLDEKY